MSSSDPRARRYLGWGAATVLLLAAALAAMTAAIDPRGLLGPTLGWPTLCQAGLKTDEHDSKPLLAALGRPKVILVGASKVQKGFLQSDADRVLGPGAFNLAMSASNFSEIADMAEDAWRGGGVRSVWIGLDYGGFSAPPSGAYRRPARLDADPRLRALWHGWLSPQAMERATHIAAHPEQCRRPLYTPRGFRAETRPGDPDPVGTADLRVGPGRDPLTGQRRSFRAVTTLPKAQREATYREEMQRLRRLLGEARSRRIEVVLFIHPRSRVYLRALELEGLDADYRRWEGDVTAIVAAAHDPHARLLDFSDDARFTGSDAGVCAAGARPTCLFYDAAHYTPAVGRRILEAGATAPQ